MQALSPIPTDPSHLSKLSRPIALCLLALGFSALILGRAQAGGGHYYPPVADPLVQEECGSCHIAFPPAMLPAASWIRMMADLKNHFGDDASLEPAVSAVVTAYLVKNAGDAGGRAYSEKLLRGLPPGASPLRITELPKWVREHRKVPDREWKHKEVRTKANCAACHVDAARGYYED